MLKVREDIEMHFYLALYSYLRENKICLHISGFYLQDRPRIFDQLDWYLTEHTCPPVEAPVLAEEGRLESVKTTRGSADADGLSHHASISRTLPHRTSAKFEC